MKQRLRTVQEVNELLLKSFMPNLVELDTSRIIKKIKKEKPFVYADSCSEYLKWAFLD